jgi:nitroimidazol reductase NimA-like FMN-containing flavoprotein (pyridoxamine 5'-phosphate oxidase superfamily)
MTSAATPGELNTMARRVIDTNHYMTLGTSDSDCRPRLSPVYYTCARYTDFYWVSSPRAQHSRNIEQRPAVEIVIFDSTAAVGEGEAVYLAATASVVADEQLEAVTPEAFRTTAGASRLTPDDLARADLRLYVASMRSCEVHMPGRHPRFGRGIDSRQPADPTSPSS